MHLFASSIVCAFFINVEVNLKEISTEFYRNNTLDGYVCLGTKLFFNVTSLGVVSCAIECSKTFTCIGIFYVPASSQCKGCSSQFDPNVKEPLAGSIFYRRKYNFSYLGCYYEALPHRILGGPVTHLYATMTTEECIYFCVKGNYTHALTEVGNECFCGNGFVLPVYKAPESDCKSPCVGNPSQICGYWFRGSVYLIN